MTAVRADELELPYLPMEDDAFSRDPMSYFAAAREVHPWLAKGQYGFIIHGYKALIDMGQLEHLMVPPHSRLVELLGAQGTRWGDFLERSIQGRSTESHKCLRDIVAPAFTPGQANRRRGLMQDVMTQLLDEWAPRGSFDFEEFASNFPITVMCQLIGASPSVLPKLKPSLEALGDGFTVDPRQLPGLQEGLRVMLEFVEALVAERRLENRDGMDRDLLDTLMEANRMGGLSDVELIELLVFLFVGGYDTSKNALTLMMYVLLNDPVAYEKCGTDMVYCRQVVDEMLRYLTVVTGAKIPVDDMEYNGVIFPKDTMIFLSWNAAGRDPAAFPDPEIFDPARGRKNRLVFGAGPHICLGQFIAKAQIEEGLHLIARRLKNPKLNGPFGWRSFIGIWGLRGLPIRFDLDAEMKEPLSPAARSI